VKIHYYKKPPWDNPICGELNWSTCTNNWDKVTCADCLKFRPMEHTTIKMGKL
jgi:hypothetical protein